MFNNRWTTEEGGAGDASASQKTGEADEVLNRVRRVDVSASFGGEELPPADEESALSTGEYGGGVKVFDWIAKGAVFLALFATPLFYFFSSDTLGLSKTLLLTALALIALAAWVAKVIAGGRLEWRGHPLLWSLLAVFAFAVAGALLNSAEWVGLFGTAGRYGFSAFTLGAYMLLGVVALANFHRRDAFYGVLAVVASGLVAMVAATLHFFGVFILPGSFTENEAFTPLGSLFGLSLFAAFLIPLLIELFNKLKRVWVRTAVGITALLSLFVLFAVNFGTAWMALAIALFVYLAVIVYRQGFFSADWRKQRQIVVPLLILVVTLLMWLVPNAPGLDVVQVPVEISPSYRAGLDVASGTLGEGVTGALFGAGPEHFPYAYGQHKSASINQTNFWGVNFVDANAEILTWITTMGILGALSLLVFVVGFIIVAFRRIRSGHSLVAIGILSAWVFILVSKFIYPTPIALELLFWVLPVLFLIRTDPRGIKEHEFQAGSIKTLIVFIASIILLVAAVGGLYFTGQRWIAETQYVDAVSGEVTEENVDGRVQSVARAIQLNPRESRYYQTLSQLLLARTQLVFNAINERPAAERQATEAESQQIQVLTLQALQSIEEAMRLEPENVSIKIAAANSYSQVSGFVEGALDRSLTIYSEAIEEEPVNPFLRTQTAQLYLVQSGFFQNSQVTSGEGIAEARNQLERAVDLNSSYSNARYFLGLILDRQGEQQAAIEQFEVVDQFNPDNQLVNLILANLRAGRSALAPPVPEEAQEPPVEDEEGAQGIPAEVQGGQVLTPTEN